VRLDPQVALGNSLFVLLEILGNHRLMRGFIGENLMQYGSKKAINQQTVSGQLG